MSSMYSSLSFTIIRDTVERRENIEHREDAYHI